MKKFLCLLFILFSGNIFAWEVKEIVDEFREPTGKIRILQFDNKKTSYLFVEKDKEDLIMGFITGYIGGKGENETSNIKIKIDKNAPVSSIGKVSKQGNRVVDFLTPKLLEQMKKGKVMKVVIEKYNDDTIFLIFELNGFSEALEKLYN